MEADRAQREKGIPSLYLPILPLHQGESQVGAPPSLTPLGHLLISLLNQGGAGDKLRASARNSVWLDFNNVDLCPVYFIVLLYFIYSKSWQ